jgi:hypothetical protein
MAERRPVVCHMTVPLRGTKSLGLEQSLGEVDLEIVGGKGVMHISLAHNGSAVYFYKIKDREDEAGHIPDGSILVVEMDDLIRMVAEMAGKGAFSWVG